jgi:hypothetical protein
MAAAFHSAPAAGFFCRLLAWQNEIVECHQQTIFLRKSIQQVPAIGIRPADVMEDRLPAIE